MEARGGGRNFLMKIAVLHCPQGITGQGAIQAFLDAGLPAAHLKKEFRKKSIGKETRNLLTRISRELGRAGIGGREAFDALVHGFALDAALRYFGVQKCFVRQVGIGKKGNPKILKLLRGFILDRLPMNKELVTASGAAILAAFCEKDDAIPSMKLESMGEGALGLRISIGETAAPYRRERILLLETNIDDMNPQGFELLYSRLFKAGALDVWVEPILMKKMRPAFKLSVLLEHSFREKIAEVLFKETPTLGVRFFELDRFALARKIRRVKTRYGWMRVKTPIYSAPNKWEGRKQEERIYPEYEDVKRIAQKRNRPFREVYEKVKKDAWVSHSSKI